MSLTNVDRPFRISLSAIILTYNEEMHIERCIRSLFDLAETIFVIDSFSTDRTVEIANRLGAIVHQRAFKNQSDQFQWGLDNLPADADWCMRVDADEYLTADLADAMRDRLPGAGQSVAGFYVDRLVVFLGRPIRHGGMYPLRSIKIWRRGRGRIEQKWMDEHCIVDGEIEYCPGDLVDENLRDLTWWTDKHNKYSIREVVDVIDREFGLGLSEHVLDGGGPQRQTAIRFLKTRIYPVFPPAIRAFLYFLYRYFVRLGFLDGYSGLAFHFLQGFWYRFLVDAKLHEARQFISKNGVRAFLTHVRDVHGLDVSAPKAG
jgi:glycosyltransferase involved in cell wall biosynthesis